MPFKTKTLKNTSILFTIFLASLGVVNAQQIKIGRSSCSNW